MSTWRGYYPDSMDHVYTLSQLSEFVHEAMEDTEILIKNKVEYFNVPASFDIETSSWSDNDNHYATMYIWQFGLNGSVIYGRTWREFESFLTALFEMLALGSKRRLIVYVHNLSYEFHWIRKYFEWEKVFAIKKRRPVYALTEGIEFRCSYFLSNYSLAYIGDELLQVYPIKKLVGALDYSKKRHSATPLSPAELAYCVNDVKVVMSYIQEKIEYDGSILEIPLTNTGYVRNYCRNQCFTEGLSQLSEPEARKIRLSYASIMKSLQVSDADEYNQLKRAFMGGFTHANVMYVNQVLYDVGSADLTSSYPYTIVAQYFPMTRFIYLGTISDPVFFQKLLNTRCCIFDIEFENLMPKVEFENIISYSRCWNATGVKLNNGRVISAQRISTTLTELDFENVLRFYQWSSIKVVNMRVANRGYLPKALIMAVLQLYEDKTKLKGISGKETEYLVAKGMINAAFGMMVMAIVRGEYAYDDSKGWLEFESNIQEQLDKYNHSFNRFLYYGWGVWVTAHARHNLFSAIYEFGADYIYADTDSIKGINFDEHADYFTRYNNAVFDSLVRMCGALHIPFDKVRPRTNKGVSKMIGVWDREEDYSIFKTAGAKRYIYEYKSTGIINMTVSGVNKKFAMPYLLYTYGGGNTEEIGWACQQYLLSNDVSYNHAIEPFIALSRLAYQGDSDAMSFLQSLPLNHIPVFAYFGEGLYIPPNHTGKQTLDYLDGGCRGICIDYLGVPALIEEASGVYMEPQHYLMSQTQDYIDLIQGVQHVER